MGRLIRRCVITAISSTILYFLTYYSPKINELSNNDLDKVVSDEQRNSLKQQRVLLFITTHMSDQHWWYLSVCWPQLLMSSTLLAEADKLVYLTTDKLNKDRAMEVLSDTFRNQNLTIKEGDNLGLQQGAMQALSEAARLHWFDGYDWVIRLNPDVIIRDSMYMMDVIQNDLNASALLINCVGDTNDDGTLKAYITGQPMDGKYMVHTDFFAVKPDKLPKEAFLKPSSSNAEQSFTHDLRSIIHNGEHRWIPNADPVAVSGKYICRAGTGRDVNSASILHFHVKDFFDSVCPINPVVHHNTQVNTISTIRGTASSKTESSSKSSLLVHNEDTTHNIDKTTPSIACVIYTYHGSRELITETYKTWAQYCDYFFAYSDEEWDYLSADGNTTKMTKTIPLRVHPAPKDTLWNDVRKIWDDLRQRYSNGSLDADFVTFSGDDAFFIMPRLRTYLQQFNGKEDRLLLGGSDDFVRESPNPWVGGAGYVITRKLIEEAALSKCKEQLTPAEDMLTSSCLFGQGVKYTDTRDDMGRGRFCRSLPTEPCHLPHGKASDEVVLFHYATKEIRSHLHEQYYKLTIY